MKKNGPLLLLLLTVTSLGLAQHRRDTVRLEDIIVTEMKQYGNQELTFLKNKLFGSKDTQVITGIHRNRKMQDLIKNLKKNSYNFSTIKTSNKSWKALMEYGLELKDYAFLESLFVHLFNRPGQYDSFGKSNEMDFILLEYQNFILYSFFAYLYVKQGHWDRLYGMLAMLRVKNVSLMRLFREGHPDYRQIFAFMSILRGRSSYCEDYKKRYMESFSDGSVRGVIKLVDEFRAELSPFCPSEERER